MIWLNPWAWLGALGVALPILIHLLGRGHATPKKFPTLRFVEVSRLLPTKRTRIHDPLLLVLRALALLFAAAALAGPLVMTANRRTSLDRGLARAIVVDTSTSMLRRTVSGRTALDIARDSAKVLAAQAQTSVIVESATPWTVLPSIAGWISAQGRRSDVMIVSDLQIGMLDRADLAAIPRDAGVAFVRIALPDSATNTAASRREVDVDAGPGQSAAVAAMRQAVAALGAIADARDTTRHITIVFPHAEDRAAVVASGAPVRDAWMVSTLRRLSRERLPIAGFASRSTNGSASLVLLSGAEPGTIAATRLLAASSEALNNGPSAIERESATVGDDSLRAWSRASSADEVASQYRPTGDNGPSDARWLWVAALVMLGAETVVRRTRRSAAPIEEVSARAA